MHKNIMVLVLSDVKITLDENNKLILSEYEGIKPGSATTSESSVRYLKEKLLDKDDNIDRLYAFATQKVQGNIIYKDQPFLDENKQPITHLDFTRKQLEKVLDTEEYPKGNWVTIREPKQAADSNSLAMNQTLRYTLQIAAAIQKDVQAWQKEDPNVEIRLYADCTGGPRHAIMMLIDIIRLLQYAKLEIRDILYSNWTRDEKTPNTVESIKDIYDFYNLIAGAEEFVNFGSVKDIQKYFQHRKNLSEPLKNLLEAMAEFSDVIKLCRSWRFEEAIKNLNEAINSFEKYAESDKKIDPALPLFNDDKHLNDLLMAQLLPQLRDTYSFLQNGHLELPLLIDWCLKNGLLQQALTLYTERLPDYLFEEGYITFNPNYEKYLQTSYEKHGGEVSEGYYFINRFDSKYKDEVIKRIIMNPINDDIEKEKKDLKDKLKELWNKTGKQANLHDFEESLTELAAQSEIVCIKRPDSLIDCVNFLQLLSERPEELETPTKANAEIQKKLWDLYSKSKSYKPEKWQEYSLQEKVHQIKDFLFNHMGKDLFKFIGDVTERNSHIICNRLFTDIKPLESFFETHTDKKLLAKVLDDYSIIKNERNHANHAKSQESIFRTAKELTEFMQESLKRLTQLKG